MQYLQTRPISIWLGGNKEQFTIRLLDRKKDLKHEEEERDQQHHHHHCHHHHHHHLEHDGGEVTFVSVQRLLQADRLAL